MNGEQLKAWLDGFSNNLADGTQAERKLLRIAVDVSEGTGSPLWQILGKDIESSDMETNPDTQSKSDILGNTTTRVNKFEISQTLDPFTVEKGSELHDILLKKLLRNAKSEFSQFNIMVMYGWLSDAKGNIYAEIHKNSTIVPTKIGGDSYVDMPITATLSNNKTYGTVKDLDKPIFEEATVTTDTEE